MISAVVSKRSPQAASRSARVSVTVTSPGRGADDDIARDPRAQVFLGRLDVQREVAEQPLVLGELVELAPGGMQVLKPLEHEVEQALVDIGAAQLDGARRWPAR